MNKKILYFIMPLLIVALALVGFGAPSGAAPKRAAVAPCEKIVAKYQYANAQVQPENEYLEATTLSCRRAAPWILVIHGGSWINGTPADIQNAVNKFFDLGWQVLNMEYRRGNDITWEGQQNDMKAAYNYIVARPGLFDIDVNKGTAFGFSAGGHMAAWLGNNKPLSSVVSVSGVLQPQRVANIDNGLGGAGDEPTTPTMHAVHDRETYMMGCDWTATMTTACRANWDQFNPEASITPASAPVISVQGDDDPAVPHQSVNGYSYWLGKQGVPNSYIHAAGYGHTSKTLWDGTAGSNSRWYQVRKFIGDHF